MTLYLKKSDWPEPLWLLLSARLINSAALMTIYYSGNLSSAFHTSLGVDAFGLPTV